MTRRTPLSVAGACAGAGAVSYSQQKPVGIGFIGLSHSHAEGKLAVVRASADWRIVGIAESDPKLQKAIREQGIALLSRDDLLKHPEIKVIAVESAVRDHAPDGLAVVEAGKHLHLEKAPADSMAAFRKIVSVARDKSLLLQVGYMWPHHPGISAAIESARKG